VPGRTQRIPATSGRIARSLNLSVIHPADPALFPQAIDPACEASVIIPVKNEQQYLPRALHELIHQSDLDGTPLDHSRYEVLVLVNNSCDASAAVARSLAESYSTVRLHVAEVDFPDDLAHVGHARKLLMDAACRRLQSIGRHRGVIASTDADTIASPTWLAATLAEVERGADAVGGRIALTAESLRSLDPAARVYHLWDVRYRLLVCRCESWIDPVPGDPWPRHFQHFGASMAVTTDAYLRAGGLPARPALEDVALYEALFRIDATIRHSPLVRVGTSARLSGRTGFGFAVQLRRWAAMRRGGEAFLAESADALIHRLRLQRRLRSLWARSRRVPQALAPTTLERLAAEIGISADALGDELAADQPFGQTLLRIFQHQRVAGEWGHRYPDVDIVRATRDLRAWMERARFHDASESAALEQIEPVEPLTPAS
jgi:glycosyltransferase involved in cell wall biosynthesis